MADPSIVAVQPSATPAPSTDSNAAMDTGLANIGKGINKKIGDAKAKKSGDGSDDGDERESPNYSDSYKAGKGSSDD